jgi:hypothetical protein
MAEWFVYQYDVFPTEMDPDVMGIMLVPVYDASGDIIYRDCDVANNCVRRIQSKWGIDPDIKQYDIVVRAKPQQQQHVPRAAAGAGLPPLHSSAPQSSASASQAGLSSGIVHPNPNPSANPSANYSVRWFPTNQEFKCTNEVGGFQFENTTTKQCLAVSTNPHTLKKEVTLMGQDVYGKYSACVADVIGVRIHKLALFSPGNKDKDASSTWFSKYVTAHTSAA